MRQFINLPVELPPPAFLSFLIPLSVQCLFLHPIFPARLSAVIRFLLTPLSVVLSLTAPYRYEIGPVKAQAVGVNFVLGIAGAYGTWKAVEWGLAQDLTPYTWVGFEEDKADESSERDGNGPKREHGRQYVKPTSDERRQQKEEEKEHLLRLRERQAATEGPIQILRSTVHLLGAMRGQGYAFCGTSTKAFVRQPPAFFRRLLLEIAWSHPLVVACAATLLEPPTSRDAIIYSFLPHALRSTTTAHYLGETITGFSMGIAVFAALTLGYSVATLLVFLAIEVPRALPIPSSLKPPAFDAREYPPLFNFAKRPSSVAVFWSKQWHSFFARPFRFLAFDPLHRLITPYFGKLTSRTLGVLAVFALSSWLHEFGLSSATSTLASSPRPLAPMSFVIRWGGSIYFMSQAVGIILEGAFFALTKKKVGGWIGTLWTACFVIGVGGLLYRSWITQGLLREVPPFQYWGWQRIVLPLGCLMPPPMWMNSLPAHYAYERHA